MTAAAPPPRETRLNAVLALGIGPLVASVLTVALAATYEGPRWLGWHADVSGAFSLILIAGTLTAPVRTVRKGSDAKARRGRTDVRIGAYPTAALLLHLAYAISGALGIFW